jgi:hypothetical protein
MTMTSTEQSSWPARDRNPEKAPCHFRGEGERRVYEVGIITSPKTTQQFGKLGIARWPIFLELFSSSFPSFCSTGGCEKAMDVDDSKDMR